MTAVPFLTSFAAFLLLGLASNRHHRQRFGRPCAARTATMLRSGASVLLALGIVPAVIVWGGVFGPIAWTGTLLIGAALAFSALNFA